MRRLIIAFMAAVALAGCGSNGSTSAPPGQPGSINTGSPTAAPPPPDWTVPLMQTPYSPKVDPAQFSDKITNKYFPLVRGTVMVYEGKRDGVPPRIELTVTNETKDIFGVRTIVVRDIVTGALEERTSDWYAQDAAGNVWYFGEDTKEYTTGLYPAPPVRGGGRRRGAARHHHAGQPREGKLPTGVPADGCRGRGPHQGTRRLGRGAERVAIPTCW